MGPVPRALVLFSGGQDSTTCLAWALRKYTHVETIGFDYGQRHRVELDCRQHVVARLRRDFPEWGEKLGHDQVVSLALLKEISDTALTRDVEIEMGKNNLPTTFVPGRNILFLTAAAAVAYRRDIKVIVGGMCETDFSGYPDCRDDAIKALQAAINLGMERRFVFETPLMWIDKGQIWGLAEELGGEKLVRLIEDDTHTCYLGDRTKRHAWGYGCGACPACVLRGNGYEAYVERTQRRHREVVS
jgi:7-cyano-7-deazaguanine synthase